MSLELACPAGNPDVLRTAVACSTNDKLTSLAKCARSGGGMALIGQNLAASQYFSIF
jgi:hypothetical protein